MAHERQLIQIDVAAALDYLLYRRVFLSDNDRRDRRRFAREASFGHVAARHLAREIESDLGFSLGDFAVEDKLELAYFAV